MNPDPIHIRRIHVSTPEGEELREQLFVGGTLTTESNGLLPETLARKIADHYGVYISMDVLGKDTPVPEDELETLPTTLTEDHLQDNAVSFNPVHLPSARQLYHAQRAFSLALAHKLNEAADVLELPRDRLKDAVRVLDSTTAPGVHRAYIVNRRINPAHALFVAEISFIPNSAAFSFHLGDIEVREGLFREEISSAKPDRKIQ